MEEKGETTYPIIYIKGYSQPTASKPDYKL